MGCRDPRFWFIIHGGFVNWVKILDFYQKSYFVLKESKSDFHKKRKNYSNSVSGILTGYYWWVINTIDNDSLTVSPWIIFSMNSGTISFWMTSCRPVYEFIMWPTNPKGRGMIWNVNETFQPFQKSFDLWVIPYESYIQVFTNTRFRPGDLDNKILYNLTQEQTYDSVRIRYIIYVTSYIPWH